MADTPDIRIRIGRRRKTGAPFPVNVILGDGRVVKGQLEFDPTASCSSWPGGVEEELAAALFQGDILTFVSEVLKTKTGVYLFRRIFFEIIAEELYPFSWELIAGFPPLNASATPLQLIRCIPQLSNLTLTPFTLPIHILYADLIEQTDEPRYPDHLGKVYKYFATTVATRADAPYLLNLLRGHHFEVVHLYANGVWVEDGQGVLRAPFCEKLYIGKLKRVLKRCGTRLLILEVPDANHSPLLDLAHRLMSPDSPTVIILSWNGLTKPPIDFLTKLYLGIVHDQPLDSVMFDAQSSQSIYGAILQTAGGENILRISGLGDRLHAESEAQLSMAQEALEHLELITNRLALKAPSEIIPTRIEAHRKSLNSTIERLIEARDISLDYRYESGGMVPLTKAYSLFEEVHDKVDEVRGYTDRVVNTWFETDLRALKKDESLVTGGLYSFHLQVGAPSEKTNVREAQAIPEKELERFYTTRGLELRVVLFSDDFGIEEPDRILRLPKPPQESEELKFQVTAPARTGVAELRACVYYRLNLIQSLLVKATITGKPQSGVFLGNQAEVDFALTGSLRDIESLSERTLNVITNESHNGTHRFAIVGTNLKTSLTLTEGEMRSSINDARSQLQAICSTFDRKGKPDQYRFGTDNRGSKEAFRKDIIRLAQFGYELFNGLILNKSDWDFTNKLQKLLLKPKTIQISMAKSANYVFPWAVVYDKDLIIDDSNELCPNFLSDLEKSGPPGFLENQPCIKSGCHHQENKNIVCPSGFWGFKHIIEQPLSMHSDKNTRGYANWKPKIPVNGSINLVMAVSENLPNMSSHMNEVKGLPGVYSSVHSSRNDIGKAIRRTDIHVVYFYCHGGRSGQRVWLGVGNKEKLLVSDLTAWKVRWPVLHPLVFINGCHTVDLTPDDLLKFNRAFAYLRASGVIGTEITIPEKLAIFVANGFFDDFINEKKIGKILWHQRLELLARLNPLGLAYTPYCYGDLHLSRNGS